MRVHNWGWARIAWLALIFVILLSLGLYLRPVPAVQATPVNIASPAPQTFRLPWPAYGQGAVSEKSFGALETNGQAKSAPIASIAKLVTAMVVLKQKPLNPGEKGPTLTMTADDVAFFNNYFKQDGSVVKVTLGEQISEYQVIQAMMLPSANNMADSLARWAFGSIDSYITTANSMIDEMKLSQTHISDASGFSPATVSTAQNLVTIGQAAMANPVLAEIVAQKSAVIPVAGQITNLNFLLGSDGVVGLKTGNTDQAGGCYLFAAKQIILGQPMEFVGALMGGPTLEQTMRDSQKIIQALAGGFVQTTPAKKGQLVGNYQTSWQTNSPVVLSDDLNATYWRESPPKLNEQFSMIKPPKTLGATVGQLNAQAGQSVASVNLILKNDLTAPPWTWRLLR